MDPRLASIEAFVQALESFLGLLDGDREAGSTATMEGWRRCEEAFQAFAALQSEALDRPLSDELRARIEQARRLQVVAQSQVVRMQGELGEELAAAQTALERLGELRRAETPRVARSCDVRG